MAGQEENNKQTIGKIKSEYEYFTSKASEISRNLALGGIAVIWIFKTTVNGQIELPQSLLKPLLWLVSGLGLDLLQYVTGGLIWFIYFKYKEAEKRKGLMNSDGGLNAPGYLPMIIHIFYIGKLICAVVGYAYLLSYMWNKLSL